jgi:hypothetical protein
MLEVAKRLEVVIPSVLRILPSTSNLNWGSVVPMPTLPELPASVIMYVSGIRPAIFVAVDLPETLMYNFASGLEFVEPIVPELIENPAEIPFTSPIIPNP